MAGFTASDWTSNDSRSQLDFSRAGSALDIADQLLCFTLGLTAKSFCQRLSMSRAGDTARLLAADTAATKTRISGPMAQTMIRYGEKKAHKRKIPNTGSSL